MFIYYITYLPSVRPHWLVSRDHIRPVTHGNYITTLGTYLILFDEHGLNVTFNAERDRLLARVVSRNMARPKDPKEDRNWADLSDLRQRREFMNPCLPL